MQIILDTSNPKDLALIDKIFGPALAGEAQPQVAQNSGTVATGNDLSPEGNGVSGAVAEAAAPAPEKKPRKKKEEVAEPVVDTTPVAEPETKSVSDKPASLDEVRAALQAFTAKSGVPAGIELLKKYNAARISELEEQHYGAFIADCQ